MIKRILIILLSMAGSVAFSSLSVAAPSDEAVQSAEEAELQAKLATTYKQALAAADKSQVEAAALMEIAREQLHQASEQRHQVMARSSELRDRQRAEMAAMREELNRAQRQLRESSRQISRVNRDIARANRAGMSAESSGLLFISGDRPVLGIILGDTTDVGIKVLGLSPDGPAERAGIEAGDVIVAMGGDVLAIMDETGNVRHRLNIALQDMKANEPVVVSIERGRDTLDLTVVPEVRESLSWQSIVRFPSVANAPALAGNTIMIERIVVPEIDTATLAEQIKKMRIEIDVRRVLMEAREFAPLISHFEFQFDNLSEMGDFALHDTNAWFGMPLASGLRLAAIDPALGEYFKTDRGVLVLKTKEDNELLLQAGDVILSIQGNEVNSPAEFMRALREFEPGDELIIDIKRKRKSKTLKPIIEDSHARFFAPKSDGLHMTSVMSYMIC